MSNVLYGGKILISENGSPKMDKKIKGDSSHHHPDTGNILEDKEEKTEISAEYAEEHQEDEEDGDDDEEATEEEEFLCPVCQGGEEELDSFAKLAECEHVFCEPCITEWSKNADTCPICRNRFDHLCTCDTLRGDYSTKVKIEYKSKDSVTVEVEHYVCQICHSGQNEELLLLCDGCDEAYHTHCLRPQLDNIPDGDWFCVQCSGGGEEEEEGLDINPGSGSIQFRLPSTTRRLAMEELLRRTRRTSDRRTSRAERRRSSSISQAVQLISSITGRARTAKGAKLARIATRTVGIHTLRGLRNKRNKRSKRRAANSAAWSPPRKSSPERLEAWNQRDTRPSDLTSSEVAGFSTAAIRAHKAPKAESVLGAHRYFEEAQPGPSTRRDSAVNPTPVNVLDLITADIINATSKTATVDKKGDIVYKTRDEVLKEKDTKNAPKQSVDQESPVRQRKVRIDSSKCSPSKTEEKKSSKRKRDSTSEKRPKAEEKRDKSSEKRDKSSEKRDKSSEKRDKSSEKSKSGGGKRKSSKKESRSRSRSYSSSPRRRRSSKSVKSPPKTASKKEADDSIISENSNEVPAVKDSAGKEDVVKNDVMKASDSRERKEISENEKKSAKLLKPECSDKETSSSKRKSSSDDKRKTGSFSDNKDDGKEETSNTAPEETKNVKKSKHAKSSENTHVKTDKRSDEKSDKGSSNKSKSSRNDKLGKENENENTSVEKEAKKRKKEKVRKKKKKLKSKDRVCSKEKKSLKKPKSRSKSSSRSRVRSLSRSRSRVRSLSRSRSRVRSVSRSRSNSLHIIENLRDKYSDKPDQQDSKHRSSSHAKHSRAGRNDSGGRDSDKRISKGRKRKTSMKLDEFGRDKTLRKAESESKKSSSPHHSLEILKGTIRLNEIPSPPSSLQKLEQKTNSTSISDNFTGALGSLDDVYSPGDESPLDDVWPTKSKAAETEEASTMPNLSQVQLPSLTSIVEKLAAPGFSNTMKNIGKERGSETGDSDDMIIDSGDGDDTECSPSSPQINTVSDLVIKMKRAEEMNNIKTPSPKTPEFLIKEPSPGSITSPPAASPGMSTPEYLMTPPELQEERRRDRVRKQTEIEKRSREEKHPVPDRKKRSSDTDKRRRPSDSNRKSRDSRTSSRTEERKKSESGGKKASSRETRKHSESKRISLDADKKRKLSEGGEVENKKLVIPLLDASPPPPPPPPPRGSLVIQDHGEAATSTAPSRAGKGTASIEPHSAGRSPLANGKSCSAPLVYVNNNSQPTSKLSNLATLDFSNGSMVRKRSRLDPPAPSTMSVTDIMGSPSIMLTALNDSYALEQFNDAWSREAQSPTSYTPEPKRFNLTRRENEDETKPDNPDNQHSTPDNHRVTPDNRTPIDPRETRMSTVSNPLKMIMESIERELLDTIGSEDMDIEEDDVPPPPPPATQQPPHLSPSTTPLRPPPTSTATNTKVKPKVKGTGEKDKGEKDKGEKDKGEKDKGEGKPGKHGTNGNVQQEIANIVKLALKVPYKKKKITKEEYKNIMKQVVSKVYESRHVKRGDPLRPDKITEMVALYIKQSKHHKAKAKVTKTVEQADL